MAKSIRSKAKRKLRAVKREKIVAKERLKLIALKEQEEGRKMVEGEGQVQQEDTNACTTSGPSGDVSIPGENDNEVMEVSQVTSDNQTKKSEKKSLKNSHGKKVKRLGKKKKMKYKW